jgi:integrase
MEYASGVRESNTGGGVRDMASLAITTRQTASGLRYVVRYRLGGRAYPIVHGGSFKTLREARARRDLVAGELAAGRNPALVLRAPAETPRTRTFSEVAEAYRASRVDFAPASALNLQSQLRTIVPYFDGVDVETLTAADVQEWVSHASERLKPSSVRRHLIVLRAVLDHAGLDPNPARDPRVKLPRQEQTTVEPPSADEVALLVEHVAAKHRLPLRVLEQTGMRVGELHALEWRDVDLAHSRFRVRQGKTQAARRWAACPEWLIAEVSDTCPPDDRAPERRVFPGCSPNAVKAAMQRACKHAGIASYSPHDLRHRYASVQIGRGVPVTQVAAQLGHSRNSLTLDVYSHVLLDEAQNT